MSHFVIEIRSDHNLKKIDRRIVHGNDVVIGRAYSCGIVIDDIYVSREHLKISVIDGGFMICDLDTKNGTFLKKSRLKDDAKVFQSGEEVKIGHTLIRIFAPDHELPPTKKYKWNNHLNDIFCSYTVAIPLMLISIALVTFYLALYSTSHDYYETEIYEDALGMFFLFWGGVLITVLGGIMSRDQVKLPYVISFFSAGFIVLIMLDGFSNYIEPRFLDVSSQMIFLSVLYVLVSVIFLVVYTYIYYGRVRMKDWAGTAFIALIILFFLWEDVVLKEEDAKLSPHYVVELPNNGWQPKQGLSPQEFIQKTETLF